MLVLVVRIDADSGGGWTNIMARGTAPASLRRDDGDDIMCDRTIDRDGITKSAKNNHRVTILFDPW